MYSGPIPQIKCAPGFHKNGATRFLSEQVLQRRSFHFPIHNRTGTLEIRVVQPGRGKDAARWQLRPARSHNAKPHPRIESIRHVFQRPSINRNPQQAEIPGPNRDPEMVRPAWISARFLLEGHQLARSDDEFVRTKSEIGVFVLRSRRVSHQAGAWRERDPVASDYLLRKTARPTITATVATKTAATIALATTSSPSTTPPTSTCSLSGPMSSSRFRDVTTEIIEDTFREISIVSADKPPASYRVFVLRSFGNI